MTTTTAGPDPFGGNPSGTHETPGIFASLTPGQSARGIFLGMVPGGLYGEQPAIFSMKAQRVMIWPAHQLLIGALAELPAWTPVEITRLAIPGRAAKYTVRSWPQLPGGETVIRPRADVALKETLELLAKVRKGGAPALPVQTAPVDGAGPLNPEDEDLPF